MRAGALCLRLWSLAATHLLGFEVLVQKVKCLLVRTWTTGDGEHALASVVVRSLGDRDTGTGALADLADLAATASNDAADHVSGDADVLSLDILSFLYGRRWAALRASVAARWVGLCGCTTSEVSSVAGTVVRSLLWGAAKASRSTSAVNWRRSTSLDADYRAVEDGAISALLIVDEALANLPSSLLDALGRTLDFNNALSRLWEHFLLCDHAYTRGVLDLLNLESLAANDSAHLVVRDQQANGWKER